VRALTAALLESRCVGSLGAARDAALSSAAVLQAAGLGAGGYVADAICGMTGLPIDLVHEVL